jgi:putative membrane protein
MSIIGNIALEKRLNSIAYFVSAIVLLAVVGMRKFKIATSFDFSALPAFHATLNSITALLLLLAFYFIKKGEIANHRKMTTSAMIISAIFLVSYVLYHVTTVETKFGGEGNIRFVYFFLLITHIITAALILPFVLLTFNRAYTGSIERHKKMARWVYPFWLYVAITGPICYLMLKPYY